MTTLLIEMPAGVAGDMLLAALADLGGDLAGVERDLLALGVGPIRITRTPVQVSGITAVRVEVAAEQEAQWEQPVTGVPAAASGLAHTHPHPHGADHGHHHHDDLPHLSLSGAHPPHRPYRVIRDLLAAAALPPGVIARAQRVFRVLAEAEGAVHGVAADEIEFHEVGALDAIADVVGCCLLLDRLGVTRIVAGPLLPGSGWVRCAHGRMPVPVPAVAAMLAASGAPQRQSADETGELTTPTGAALVIALADAWLRPGPGLAMTTRRVGYGAGHRTIPGLANVLRASLADDDAATPDTVAELRCQIDDATGEQLAALLEELLTAGARDAWLTPIVMKKGRPGHALTVLCAPADRERITALVLTRSTSIGVRHQLLERSVLPRRSETVGVCGQTVAVKVVTLPDGTERAKPEADDVAAAARALGRPFIEIQRAALAAWERTRPPAP
jgi:uncharacterized protein (TIGR00299 family) protein